MNRDLTFPQAIALLGGVGAVVALVITGHGTAAFWLGAGLLALAGVL